MSPELKASRCPLKADIVKLYAIAASNPWGLAPKLLRLTLHERGEIG